MQPKRLQTIGLYHPRALAEGDGGTAPGRFTLDPTAAWRNDEKGCKPDEMLVKRLGRSGAQSKPLAGHAGRVDRV